MPQLVDVGHRSLEAYRGTAPDAILDDLRTKAQELHGARVLHLNATAYGGGVSELLRSVVPLLVDLGIAAEWRVIHGDARFFELTKQLHNGLQGSSAPPTEGQWSLYERMLQDNARELVNERYDYVFVHDPQPAGVLALHGSRGAHWVWRCHIDTSEPNRETWAGFRRYLEGYDAAVFTMDEFVPADLPIDRVEVIPPAIDPLSPKNFDIPDSIARGVVEQLGLPLGQPLVTQVSRFDPWKDPLGVIEAYRLAREVHPQLRLALVGSMALDDPEGWAVYDEITGVTQDDPLVNLFTNLTGVGNIEVNAFQRLSDICIQKSIREGFGLVVSEAIWKRTPMVAGRAGGIPLQMADGAGGVLVDSVEECARAIVDLLDDPQRAAARAERGRERVAEYFLTPRLVLNELALLADLASEAPRAAVTGLSFPLRDLVCGMAIGASPPFTLSRGGRTYGFCSATCRDRFAADAPLYIARRPSSDPDLPVMDDFPSSAAGELEPARERS